jgi:hypothetical protein
MIYDPTKKPYNKYGVAAAVDRTYGVDAKGKPVVYHSAAEAERAQELDLLLRGKVIASWRRQVLFRLGPVFKYVADFVVDGFDFDGTPAPWVEEVKGMKKPRDREMERFWAEYGPYPLFIYSERSGKGWGKTQRIEGAQQTGDDDG